MTAAFQDFYGEDFNQCYGCGTANPDGYHLKSYWDDNGEGTIAHFTPDTKYSGGTKDIIYGGMVASLMDCHGTGSSAALLYKNQGRTMGDDGPAIRCVTASLTVNFLRPTPMGVELEVRGKLIKIERRKVWIELSLSANGDICASGEMLAIALKAE